jgi:hypothetical protein
MVKHSRADKYISVPPSLNMFLHLCIDLYILILSNHTAYSFAAISECVIAASNLGFQSMKLLDFKSLKSVYRWDSSDLSKMTKSD